MTDLLPEQIEAATKAFCETIWKRPSAVTEDGIRAAIEAYEATRTPPDGEWRPIETAPRDGTAFQAVIPGHGTDNVLCWIDGLLDSDGKDCGGWVFASEQEPPDCWTDGYCWDVNEDGVVSVKPTKWKPLPEALQASDNRLAGRFCGFDIVENPEVPAGEIWAKNPAALQASDNRLVDALRKSTGILDALTETLELRGLKETARHIRNLVADNLAALKDAGK